MRGDDERRPGGLLDPELTDALDAMATELGAALAPVLDQFEAELAALAPFEPR